MRTYTSYNNDWQSLTGNASSTNQTLGLKLINDNIRYLATSFYFNEVSYTVPGGTVSSQQGYTLPSDFEQLENVTVSVGGYLWQPRFSASRKQWDLLNLISYKNDFPQYCYIWNGQLLLWPIPASSNNAITINYKKRVIDLAMADYTTGTVSTDGSTTITGSGTTFPKWSANSGWIQIAVSNTDASSGDNRWYQVSAWGSATSLTLKNAYVGNNCSGASYILGDVPILPEDYQDMPLYHALEIYFTSVAPDPNKVNLYKGLYQESYVKLNEKYGAKDYTPELTDMRAQVYNPNLFPRNLS